MKTFRIPKGLWDDLEETIIRQDRSFLTEVARSLGLPVADVLRRCLGTGANQVVPVLWMSEKESEPDENKCPWWDLHGAIWRPCCRIRLSPFLPCYKHERAHSSPTTKIRSDPYIAQLPLRFSIRRNGKIFWVSETDPTPLSEDGFITEGKCYIVSHNGKKIAIWKDT